MSLLKLSNIHKSYFLGKTESKVLNGINLEFNTGEFVSILGESGGGKSTLMNIIGGLDRNFDGEVALNGEVLDHRKEKQLDNYRRGTIGYIYQSYNLITHLTVLENVLVSLEMTALSHTEKIARAKDLLTQVGLADQTKKHPNQLSGGQKQRVAIARALASDPDIILADEPTGALDSVNTQEVLEILNKIAKDGKLVIAVTHSQAVADHGTRIIRLVDGQVEADEHLKEPYKIENSSKRITSHPLPASASYVSAFRHLIYNIKQNSLIILGTAIGIFAVLLFSGLGNGINTYINDQINSLVNPKTITVMANPSGKKLNNTQAQREMQQFSQNPTNFFISQAKIDAIKKTTGTSYIQPGYQLGTYSLNYNDKNVSSSGIQTYTKSYTSNSLNKGSWPTGKEIVISKNQAITLSGSSKKYRSLIGKNIDVTINWLSNNNSPVQMKTTLTVSGISDSSSGVSSEITVLSYSETRSLLSSAGARTDPNFIIVNSKNIDTVDNVANQIRKQKVNGKYAFSVMTVGDILKTVNNYVSLASTVLSAIAGISLVVSALMIIVTMYMSVAERTKEIGILRALGERRKDIRRLFTAESLLLGLFSAFLGLLLAWLFSILLNNFIYGLIKFNIVQINLANVIFAIVVSLLISLLAALLPARKASKLNPIDALSAD
ncbi:MAG: ATP-binding cassette domain-containing protein [Liquorilactobacillus hordei]|uniref:ABC transporter ATP-binding protein n=1 Tax=Liquorilactobacillus hordei TaxID=468911 RepID=A0A3S6QRM8_9LACO|nr:ABC transporter ATP-binding protein/permease [Liquorilactobacillus hordei]AUJ28887.1 ABC transporter ATP-binding protein [Liquorilactobacillus hordei]MBZ2406284.1 ABC transporter ATP-binding protein [Liquorilactobacillus hordei]